MLRHTFIIALTALALLGPGRARSAPPEPPLRNGLAQTPPMGWSSWNQFGDQINEQLLVQTMDAMAANGLRDAGYVYVNLDDGWQRHKGARKDHPLEVDPVKFPRGLRWLADYAHAKGFKLGIYSGPGQTTCAGYTGSEGHEQQDAKQFAAWGVDHLKYDSCCSHKDAPKTELQPIVKKMARALQASGRPIVYHACHCGWADIWQWAADAGANHWRIGQDISDDFDYPGHREKYYFDVLDMLDRGIALGQHTGPGHWNDFDMLVVGLNGKSQELVGAGASNVEYRTHFSLWALAASPLLIGADVRSLDAYTLETLSNREVIALNQDPLGQPAEKVRDDNGTLQIYAKELANGSVAVALLNRGSATADMTISPRRDLTVPWKHYRVRDLWRHAEMGTFDSPFTTEVISHEARVLLLTPVAGNPTNTSSPK
ncbi:MAG TPA: glycoside hydrolase family 27 protein [Ideonella sp.]|uniref:glycoside hydrolase family 27 protein n=1 Tax=Ideonella sp. TaxID=1929293 RepID=UPI002E37464F|nr:glycoside hydrolase family 27 protein [Ideonella sp.]HEX5685741.1 glycoside hydrolase family 27 protein [Ideonella sp.]